MKQIGVCTFLMWTYICTLSCNAEGARLRRGMRSFDLGFESSLNLESTHTHTLKDETPVDASQCSTDFVEQNFARLEVYVHNTLTHIETKASDILNTLSEYIDEYFHSVENYFTNIHQRIDNAEDKFVQVDLNMGILVSSLKQTRAIIDSVRRLISQLNTISVSLTKSMHIGHTSLQVEHTNILTLLNSKATSADMCVSHDSCINTPTHTLISTPIDSLLTDTHTHTHTHTHSHTHTTPIYECERAGFVYTKSGAPMQAVARYPIEDVYTHMHVLQQPMHLTLMRTESCYGVMTYSVDTPLVTSVCMQSVEYVTVCVCGPVCTTLLSTPITLLPIRHTVMTSQHACDLASEYTYTNNTKLRHIETVHYPVLQPTHTHTQNCLEVYSQNFGANFTSEPTQAAHISGVGDFGIHLGDLQERGHQEEGSCGYKKDTPIKEGWMCFTPACTGTYKFSMCDAPVGVYISIQESCRKYNKEEACSTVCDSNCAPQTGLNTHLVAGESKMLRVVTHTHTHTQSEMFGWLRITQDKTKYVEFGYTAVASADVAVHIRTDCVALEPRVRAGKFLQAPVDTPCCAKGDVNRVVYCNCTDMCHDV